MALPSLCGTVLNPRVAEDSFLSSNNMKQLYQMLLEKSSQARHEKEIETRKQGEKERERDRKRKREGGITHRLEGEPEMVYAHFLETFQGTRPGDHGKVFICI